MYVYYEHLRDPAGKLLATELRLSSRGYGCLSINIKDPTENLLFKLCVPVLKAPDSRLRTFDEATKVWSYTGAIGETILANLKAVTAGIQEIKPVAVEDLSAQCASGRIKLGSKRAAPLNAEEFFYNHGVSAAKPLLTSEQIQQKLTEILGPVIDKSAYRKAALRLHPDRNNGDGSRMSELNMLWGLYNA